LNQTDDPVNLHPKISAPWWYPGALFCASDLKDGRDFGV